MPSTVIFSLASRYKYHDLKPFIESLFKTSFGGNLVLFGNQLPQSTKSILVKHKRIELVEYDEKFPYFKGSLADYSMDPGQYLSPNSLRYFLYRAYLESLPKQDYPEHILHSDIRDVYFQSNPFVKLPTGNYLECALEDEAETIALNQHNSFWITHGFGKEELEKIGGNPISCSGITLADSHSFLRYLSLMTEHLLKIKNVGGMDQGVHNYLLYNEQIPEALPIADDEGRISTISSFKPLSKIRVDAQLRVLGKDNQVIPIVHQYDRYWRLLWRWNKTDYFKRKLNLLKRFIVECRKTKTIRRLHLQNLRQILFGKQLKQLKW